MVEVKAEGNGASISRELFEQGSDVAYPPLWLLRAPQFHAPVTCIRFQIPTVNFPPSRGRHNQHATNISSGLPLGGVDIYRQRSM